MFHSKDIDIHIFWLLTANKNKKYQVETKMWRYTFILPEVRFFENTKGSNNKKD